MTTTPNTLRAAIEDTQRQLSQLVASVNELTTAVKLEDSKRTDVERRVVILERSDDRRSDRVESARDQRSGMLQMIAMSGAVSFIVSITLYTLSHVSFH